MSAAASRLAEAVASMRCRISSREKEIMHMPKLDRSQIQKGRFMISEAPGCRGQFVGPQDLPPDYEREFTDEGVRPARIEKADLSPELRALQKKHGAVIEHLSARFATAEPIKSSSSRLSAPGMKKGRPSLRSGLV